MIPSAGAMPRPAPLERLETVLPNGLRTIVVPRPAVGPLAEVRLLIPLRDDDRAAAAVYAALVREEAAARMDDLGATFEASVRTGWLRLSGGVLLEHLDACLRALVDALSPSGDVRSVAGRLASQREAELAHPATGARERFRAVLYGEHPYGRPDPSPASLRDADPGRVRVSPDGSVLLVVGPVDGVPDVEWSGGSRGPVADEPVPAFQPGPPVVVERPGALQTTIVVGGRAPRRGDPSYPAFRLVHTVFGGTSTSRLIASLRERHGYAYSPYSFEEHLPLASSFSVTVPVSTAVTRAALDAILDEAARLARDGLSADELRAVARTVAGQDLRFTQPTYRLADRLADLVIEGSGEIADGDVSVEDALDAARAFDPSRLAVVLVG